MEPWQKNRKITKEFFSKRQDEGLSLNSSPWATLAVGKELQQLVIEKIIKEGMSAVDIGCGIGIEAMYLAKQGLRVTGIDFIAKSIEIAKKIAALTAANVDFICDDFMEMNLSDYKEKFNLAIDQGCFHSIPIKEKREYAKRVYSLLSKDGLFFLRGFSDQMWPAPDNTGPIRMTSGDIINTFGKFFSVERLYRFQNIPVPGFDKPQIFWAFLGKKRA